jgi:hypothetical protein
MLPRLPVALAALLSLATVVVATPAGFGRLQSRSPGRVCGSDVDPDVAIEKERTFAKLIGEKATNTSSSSVSQVTIDVYVHVVYPTDDLAGANIP